MQRPPKLCCSAVAIAALALSSCTEGGLNLVHVSYSYPAFSHLNVFADRLTAISPDLKTLRALTFDGRELWRRPLADPPLVGRYDKDHLYIQEQSGVLGLDVNDGTVQKMFDVPRDQQFVKDIASGFTYLMGAQFDKHTFQLLDSESRLPLWQRDDVEQILYAGPDVVVAATATREYAQNPRGFTTHDTALTALNRLSGKELWRIPVTVFGFIPKAVTVSTYFIAANAGALLSIDLVSGRIVSMRTAGSGYSAVAAQGDGVAFLERGTDGETFLRFASVPTLDVLESVALAGDEPTLSMRGNYVLLKGLEHAMCFDRRTGKTIWQRTLVLEWKLLDKGILISDYDNRTERARLLSVDESTGKERIIVSEPAWPLSRARR